jgi:REP element-mobilizing transposase RayT
MDNRYNPNFHHRRSIRFQEYDYSTPGSYFITICTQHRRHLFGKITNENMILNNAGKMIKQIWNNIPNDFNNIQLHEFIIMPNHIHGIIEIPPVGADSISAQSKKTDSAPNGAEWAEMDSAPTDPTTTDSPHTVDYMDTQQNFAVDFWW